jgi:hypothetical protein
MIPFADNWGGCQRMYHLAQSLVLHGNKIWVASSKNTKIADYYGQKIDFNQIIIEHPFHKFKNDEKRLISDTRPKSGANLIKRFRSAIIYNLDRILFNEPNRGMGIYSIFWVRKALKPLLAHITKNSIDTVLLSGPPFTVFSFARNLKKSVKSLKIVLDYRDPWNLWNYRKNLSSFIERIYLSYADLVVVSTKSLQTAMKDKFKQVRIATVYNGFSLENWSRIEPGKAPDNRIVISYIGAINFRPGSFRDTTEFFKAYEKFPQKSIFEIRFIGAVNNEYTQDLKSRFPEIIFTEKVSVEESLKLMTESHLLLSIHTSEDRSSKYLIGAKIFDYLRSGRTIFSINNPESYEHKFLRDKNSICCPNNSKEIQKVLSRLADDRIEIIKRSNRTQSVSEEMLAYSRENQNRRYIEVIKTLSET